MSRVVLLRPDAGSDWDDAVAALAVRGFPIRTERLSAAEVAGTPYESEAAVVVRPDLIVAGHGVKGRDANLLLESVLSAVAG